MRLVQLQNGTVRRVAVVEEPRLRLLTDVTSVYQLIEGALTSGIGLGALIRQQAGGAEMDYESVYGGKSDWRLLAPIDHPRDPARTMISGTGLTHLGSARDRDSMHDAPGKTPDASVEAAAPAAVETDSMRMFRAGVAGGRPEPGQIGTAPEWFYKGNGSILRGHGQPLNVPPFGEDGGEEAEIAGVYVIDRDGVPRRIGLAAGNEFSDHVFEKKNYLNLAGSKLRECSIGPELVLGASFRSIGGQVSIQRGAQLIWTKTIRTGESDMCHSLSNIEHHHFKFDGHRRPGDVHVHFFGAAALSFGDGVRLVDGDEMIIRFEGFGRPLKNVLRTSKNVETLVRAAPLT